MKIQWLGHASFLITTRDGTQIVMDPYESGAYGGALAYGPIEAAPQIVTISHDQHEDHNYTGSLKGSPTIVKGPGQDTIRGIEIRRVRTFHDNSGGKERGENLVVCIRADGVRLAHLGDLGHVLTPEQVREIDGVDVLLSPVGGLFTIDPKEATEVAAQLRPKILIPMHYKTAKCGFPIAEIEAFLEGKQRVRRLADSTLEVQADELPEATEIVVLRHAL
ncbi:MAG: MBL fold metallo-hydrolase [bacterium]